MPHRNRKQVSPYWYVPLNSNKIPYKISVLTDLQSYISIIVTLAHPFWDLNSLNGVIWCWYVLINEKFVFSLIVEWKLIWRMWQEGWFWGINSANVTRWTESPISTNAKSPPMDYLVMLQNISRHIWPIFRFWVPLNIYMNKILKIHSC